jgi:3-deoxy-D-manno-octulosonic-acid transferase
MMPTYFFYKTVTRFLSVLGPACRLYSKLTGKYSESMDQRWGDYPDGILRADCTRPRIWIHAASVGEVGVAAAIVEALTQMAPLMEIILSTTTETGHDQAKKILPPSIPLIYAPLDIPCVVEKALAFIRPDLLVFIETEIWPNWVWRADQRGVKILLVNGRVSGRSIHKYLKIKSLMEETLKKFQGLCMIHEEDARRILLMGAPEEKIRVYGNAKFDGLLRKDEDRDQQAMAELYSIQEQEIVFVAGSTRHGEEELVLKAYGRMLQFHPGLKLFLAPRHVERSGAVSGLVKSCGLSFRLRSGFGSKEEDRRASVVIIDTMGELASVYGLATFCFCGGSLVPKGGQNILEAAARAKPVFYGPHMEDFKEARELIEEAVGEAFLVKSWQELAEKALSCLENPERGRSLGAKARAAVLQNSGAAHKYALEILKTFYPSLA